MMAKGKVESEKKGNWGSFGGDQHMHKFAPTGTQDPGQSSQEGHSGSRRGIEPQAGGEVGFYSSNVANKFGAGPQEPGCSAQAGKHTTGVAAKGGSTHMFGNRGSRRMPEGQSGPNG
jgi:hypothetical protein